MFLGGVPRRFVGMVAEMTRDWRFRGEEVSPEAQWGVGQVRCGTVALIVPLAVVFFVWKVVLVFEMMM